MTSSVVLTQDEKQAVADRIYRLVSQLNQAINDAAQNRIACALFAEMPNVPPGVIATPILRMKVYEQQEFADATAPKPIDPAPES
jgi:hypothetical protein